MSDYISLVKNVKHLTAGNDVLAFSIDLRCSFRSSERSTLGNNVVVCKFISQISFCAGLMIVMVCVCVCVL